ncbi:MAG: CHAT domain-containing protein, partial [Pseudomonadota bacterium]
GVSQDRLFMGEQASETQVKATDFSRARIIAFATHGLLAGGIAGLEEPALVFTPPQEPTALDDGLLTASEAAALNLSADLVILSACDTAGSDGTPGAEGLTGLARSFLYAGAKALLVSHWPVDDYAASALTTRLIERMNVGNGSNTLGGRAAALRHSILALMEDPKARNRAHPRIWAPFVVVGEGG